MENLHLTGRRGQGRHTVSTNIMEHVGPGPQKTQNCMLLKLTATKEVEGEGALELSLKSPSW